MGKLSFNTKFVNLIANVQPKKSIPFAKSDLYSYNKYCVQVPQSLETNLNYVFVSNNFKPVQAKNEILSYVRHIERKQPIIEKKELRYEIQDALLESAKDSISKPRNLKQKIVNNLKKNIYNWQPLNFDDQSALHYAAGKLAPNYATIYRIFNEKYHVSFPSTQVINPNPPILYNEIHIKIKLRRPEFQPKTILDFGSGLGTVSWAAQNIWPSSLTHHYCVDNNAPMLKLAKQLILGSDYSINFPNQTHCFSNCLPPSNSAPYDLVICAYSLLEMPGLAVRHILLDQLLSHTKHFLIFLEHGTTSSYNVVMDARDYILREGREMTKKDHNNTVKQVDSVNEARVFAPCPHDMQCLRSRSQQLSRTPCSFQVKYNPLKVTHPRINNAFTESYSYVVFEIPSPQQVLDNDHNNDVSRVVAPPLIRHKHVHCTLCTRSGALNHSVISKHQYGGDLYRYAKKCHAGSYFPWPLKKVSGDLESAADPEIEEEQINT